MNLATRCTECGTAFRVVPDQLKVSEGWVRCGRCTAVFNAQEQLYDLDAPTHDDVDVGLRSSDRSAPGAFMPEPAPAADLPPGSLPDAAWAPHSGALLPEPAPAPDDEAPPPTAPQGSPAMVVSIGDGAAAAPASTEGPPVQIDADEAETAPSFMRPGDGGALGRGFSRGAVIGLAGVLALTLVAQLAVAWRSELSAQSPGLRAALAVLCERLACRVDAPRRIERLTVDASGLTRIEGAALHRLSLTLRNRADTVVLPPAIELTLSDAQGAMVARRVLGLSDFGLSVQAIEPGAELPLQALLSTGERRVSGYTVEVFYP